MKPRALTAPIVALVLAAGPGTPSLGALTTITFDNQPALTPLPPTFLTSTDPAFEVERLTGNATVQLDNYNHAPGSTDFELRVWHPGYILSTEVSFELADGARFDFHSFDFEAKATAASTSIRLRSFRDGIEIDNVANSTMPGETYDYSALPGFQDIDELRLVVGSGGAQQLLFDNLRFGVVPAPGAFGVLALGVAMMAPRSRPGARRD